MKTRFRSMVTSSLMGLTLSIAAVVSAQQPTVVVDDDDITIQGCVGRVSPGSLPAQPLLVWTRGDIMLSSARSMSGPSGTLPERVFYWLDDDEDLSKHVGRMIEVKGELGEFEKGEIEIERDGEFTNIEMKLGGKTEKARVPTAWFGAPRSEGEFEIATRKIDVESVNILGACARP